MKKASQHCTMPRERKMERLRLVVKAAGSQGPRVHVIGC
jgi:hypothetical protein